MDILIVKRHWGEKILNGEKSIEVRGSNTNKRGTIGIAYSGTGKVFGTVELVGSVPLDKENFEGNEEKHRIPMKFEELKGIYSRPHGWVVRNPKKFDKPMSYDHSKGAVIWVRGFEPTKAQERV